MRIATDLANVTMRCSARRTLAAICALLSGVSCLGVGAGSASAATPAPSPAWHVVAATGPTHIAPAQSEVQRVMVGAEGGEFTLQRKTTATGKAITATGELELVKNSAEATIVSGTYEVGQPVKGAGVRVSTTVVSCTPDCSSAGSALTLSKTANATETSEVALSTKTLELSNVAGEFVVGDEVTDEVDGLYIPAGTVVTAVSGNVLSTSTYPKVTASIGLKSIETTAPLPYDASAEALRQALEAMPALGAGSVAVTGGPGGEAANPYFVEFTGPLADRNVAVLSGDGELLTGAKRYVTVSTVVPGGNGTGEIGVYLANIGGEVSHADVTVHVGPLPAGIVTSKPAEGAAGWSCTTAEREATCTYSNAVPVLTQVYPVKVFIEAQSRTGANLQSTVTVSGGGAPESATATFPIVVSATPAEPGIAAFWGGPFEADGTLSTQAGGHPFTDVAWFLVNTDRSGSGETVTAGDVRNVDVALPAGFVGDPMATERCNENVLDGCGMSSAAVTIGRLQAASIFARTLNPVVPIENDAPVFGAASQFSAIYVGPVVDLLGSVRASEDFGITVSAPHIPSTFQKAFATYTGFYGFPEAAHGKAFFANATDCAEEARVAPVEGLEADMWQTPTVRDSQVQALAPVTGCDKLKFEAYDPATKEGQVAFSFQPTSTTGSSPVGATAHLHIDQSGLTDPEKLATPDLKQSVVKLPAGFAINPSQAAGLEACSEAQMGYIGAGALPNPTRFNEAPVSCPEGSKLGSLEITTPLLEEPLQGTIYLAAQEENPFDSLIALYLVVESKRFGITLKLPGKVETDPTTGQVTAIFDYVPQQPVEDLTLHFRGGGGRSEFATPEVCGAYTTNGSWTPWSAPDSGPPAQTSDSFTVSSGCSSSDAARPFAPSFEAGTESFVAGAYSPLVVRVSRKDGEQEITHLNLTLPYGLLGKLAGVGRCSDAQIAAAEAKTGRQEQASPSCPASSLIGAVDVASGVGGEPLHVPGEAYLAGPYKGAPFSVAVITPAVAGPFDLGNVVIRSPLFINQNTAQVTVNSDAIPTILRGIPLKIRTITIDINRASFMLNPTSCEVMSAGGLVTGASGASHAFSSRFQVGGCQSLAFEPKLTATVHAKHTRRKGAYMHVTIKSGSGQANIHKVDVELPKALAVRDSTLKQSCPEAQYAANPAGCPAGSVVGHAVADTPLLSGALEGPAYFVSHGGREFPNLDVVLQGEGITIELTGNTYVSKKGYTFSRFETVPDAPISRFDLILPAGVHSALAGNGNFCTRSVVVKRKRVALRRKGHVVKRKGHAVYRTVKVRRKARRTLTMPTTITGQNGAVLKQSTKLAVQGCGKAAKAGKGGRNGKGVKAGHRDGKGAKAGHRDGKGGKQASAKARGKSHR